MKNQDDPEDDLDNRSQNSEEGFNDDPPIDEGRETPKLQETQTNVQDQTIAKLLYQMEMMMKVQIETITSVQKVVKTQADNIQFLCEKLDRKESLKKKNENSPTISHLPAKRNLEENALQDNSKTIIHYVNPNFSNLKKFDGKMSFSKWHKTFQSYCRINRVDESLMKDCLLINVNQRVAQHILEQNENIDYHQLTSLLSKKYDGKCAILEAETEIEKIKRVNLTLENIDQVSNNIENNIRIIYHDQNEDRIMKECKNVIKNISPNNIKLLLRNETTDNWNYYVASIKECIELSKESQRERKSIPGNEGKEKQIICTKCNYRGHTEKECRSRTRWDPTTKTRVNLHIASKRKEEKNQVTSPTILHKEILIDDSIVVNAALDTGSEISILDEELVKTLKLQLSDDTIAFKTIGDGGVGIYVKDPITIRMHDEEFKIKDFVVLKLPEEMKCKALIGLNILSQSNNFINLKEKKIVTIEELMKQDEDKLKVPVYQNFYIEFNNEETEKYFQGKYDFSEQTLNPSLMSGEQDYIQENLQKKFRYYKVPINLLPIANKIIQKYLDNKVIQVEKNPKFVHPIVLIRKQTVQDPKKELKPEEMYRLVSDLRLINSLTIKQYGPSINTVNEFKRIPGGGKILYSLIDLSNAYQQVLIPENMRSKYSFSADGINTYSYRTLPQGATNSAIQFSLVTGNLLIPFKEKGLIIQHIGDFLVITSETKDTSDSELIQKHDELLEQIFKIFTSNNLLFNIHKSKLFRTELRYLAYTLNPSGYTPSLQSVANLIRKIPTTKTELQRFLFGTQYFRQTLPSFALYSERLFSKLSKKKNNLFMDNTDVIHYNKIVDELLSSPTIGFPRQN
uniref:Reverse transcriptase domain-containing protein n=1 Tax=Strongyloides papillosus TaxID=174720 RepID=A0A0N5CBV9_STREA